jgi:hypothetical protein
MRDFISNDAYLTPGASKGSVSAKRQGQLSQAKLHYFNFSYYTVTATRQLDVPTPEVDQDDLALLSGALAVELAVTHPDADRSASIFSDLMRRARSSAVAHRDFVTLRRESRVYAGVSPGMRCHMLRQGLGLRIDLVRLDPGATLSWSSGVSAQEILVMTGSLLAGTGEFLAQHGLCLRRLPEPSTLGLPLCAGETGAHLYVRQLIAVDLLPEMERAWWSSNNATQTSSWEPLSEGIEIKCLRCVGTVVSTLARIAPGAVVIDHSHGLDEDCMMLQGELFLGDILLRENDYQVAPAGCNHVNSMCDTGALFYFHGCMPTAV